MRRRRLFRLDRVVLGANPEKLAAQREIPAAAAPVALSDAELTRLSELTTKRLFLGPLPPAEAYEREQLRIRRIAGGGRQ